MELNRGDWLDRVIDDCLTASLLTQEPLSHEELLDFVSEDVLPGIPKARLTKGIDRCVQAKRLVRQGAALRLAASTRDNFEARRDLLKSDEEHCRSRLHTLAAEAGLEGEFRDPWEMFESGFLTPLLQELGADFYEAVSGERDVLSLDNTTNAFFDQFTDPDATTLRKTFISFFDFGDPVVRRFALDRLSSELALRAVALPDHIVKLLSEGRRPTRLVAVLDTNFLFTFLGLHENPSDDVVEDLLDACNSVANQIAVKFYVLPSTIVEFQKVLRAAISNLDFRPTGSVSRVAQEIAATGLAKRYYRETLAVPGITADEFFGPYEQHTLTVLRDTDIELLNEGRNLTKDQVVIDDLHDQEAIQRERRAKGAKSYEANLHDMVLWHAVRRRRQDHDSPSEATSWVLTLDYGLISFDRRKRGQIGGTIPVAVTPSTFTHMLRFWVPRSDAFDRAMFGSLREPLLYVGFDDQAQQVSLRIIRALARFENSGDLSDDAVKTILTDDALRSRLTDRPDEDSDPELIQDALIEELNRQERKAREAALAAEQSRIAANRLEIESSEASVIMHQMHASLGEKDERLAALTSEVSAAAKREVEILDKVKNLERREDERRRRSAMLMFFGISFAMVVLSTYLAGNGRRFMESIGLSEPVGIGATSFVLALLLVAGETIAARLVLGRAHPIYKILKGWTAQFVAGAVALLINLAAAVIYSDLVG